MENLHVLALLDTRIYPTQHRNYKIQQIGSHLTPNTTTAKKGIMILYRNYLNPTFNDIKPGQITEVRLNHANMEFQVYFIYGTSENDDPAFFNQLETSINPEVPVIIMGNWNVVQDTVMDRTATKPNYKPVSNTTIKNLEFEEDLLDPWRQKNKTLKQYSWEKWDKSQSSRIDYALKMRKQIHYIRTQPTELHPVILITKCWKYA